MKIQEYLDLGELQKQRGNGSQVNTLSDGEGIVEASHRAHGDHDTLIFMFEIFQNKKL